ncbi:MAG: hypothetical protein Fur0024_0840 [Patescibacteria group bacterium]
MKLLKDLTQASSDEISKIIDWYGKRFSTTIKKSVKKPHLSQILSVLKKDLDNTVANKIASHIKSLDQSFTRSELHDLVSFLSKVATQKIIDVMQEVRYEQNLKTLELMKEKEYLWIKSSVFAELNLGLIN